MPADQQKEIDERYMRRCLQLAALAAGRVAPNPMVGAVLVYRDRIIGEGYHMSFGQPHAEVNCIASVSSYDRQYISFATLYVSLEPCTHFGKTPPCADLVIRHRIPEVVIGCRDPFPLVNGKGIEKLQSAGIIVRTGILEQECLELNKRFFTFHQYARPYVILKWAQTADAKIAGSGERLLISSEVTNRLVHRWRTEEASIMVGRKTVDSDNPRLDNRHWPGDPPVRLVIDPSLSVSADANIFDNKIPTIIFNTLKEGTSGLTSYVRVSDDGSYLRKILLLLHRMHINSILVEGGAFLLKSFIQEGLWDEARIITNTEFRIGEGLAAPSLPFYHRQSAQSIGSDRIEYFINDNK